MAESTHSPVAIRSLTFSSEAALSPAPWRDSPSRNGWSARCIRFRPSFFISAATESIGRRNDQLQTPEDYASLIIRYQNGQALYLRDVASIEFAPQDEYQEARANGKPAIIINIQRQPGTNVVSIADSVKAKLPEIEESLPGAVSIETLTDRTHTIRASIEDVQFELMLSISLVVMVSFLFLRTAAATFIPSLAVPLSIVGTFGVMYLAGFSLNNLTLMALTIATGFVIDDAIVVVENIQRHIDDGMGSLEAALQGAKEIGFTIATLPLKFIFSFAISIM